MGQSALPLHTFEYADRTPILVKVGRFGPYLTDGENNAYMRSGEDPNTLDAAAARELMAERGKPPKARAGKVKKAASSKTAKKPAAKTATKTATKTTSKTTKKPAAKTTAKSSTAAKEAPKEKAEWKDLKAHLGVLTDTERQLIVALRDQNKKAEEVAPELGLDVKKAKGMMLQISKKLQEAWRKADTAAPWV